MQFSRDGLSDYVDLTGIYDAELAERFTNTGHAVDSIEKHDDDSVFDLEITTNRVDAMSHLGMARELSAALGRELIAPHPPRSLPFAGAQGRDDKAVTIRVEAPHMCRRSTALAIRGVTIKPSPRRPRRHHRRVRQRDHEWHQERVARMRLVRAGGDPPNGPPSGPQDRRVVSLRARRRPE